MSQDLESLALTVFWACEADSDFIITVDDSGGLGISQILKHLSLQSRFWPPRRSHNTLTPAPTSIQRVSRRVHRDGRVDEAPIAAAGEVVKRAGHVAGFRPRQVGGVRENVQRHVRGAEDFATIPVRSHEAKKPIQLGHCCALRCRSLGAGQGTGSWEDPAIHAPPIVEQVADSDL